MKRTKTLKQIEPQQVNFKALKAMARICPTELTRYALGAIQIKGKDAIVTDGHVAVQLQVLSEPVGECLLKSSNFKPGGQRFELSAEGIRPKALETETGQFPDLQAVIDPLVGKPKTKVLLNIENLEKVLSVLKAAGYTTAIIEIVPPNEGTEFSDQAVAVRPYHKGREFFRYEAEETNNCAYVMPMRA